MDLGASWVEREAVGPGIPFPTRRERFERLEETLQIAQQRWSDNPVPSLGRVTYAEEAGLLITDGNGRTRTHWNLRGRIILPYIAGGEVVDLRTRTYDSGKGYRSLGPYLERGAAPFLPRW